MRVLAKATILIAVAIIMRSRIITVTITEVFLTWKIYHFEIPISQCLSKMNIFVTLKNKFSFLIQHTINFLTSFTLTSVPIVSHTHTHPHHVPYTPRTDYWGGKKFPSTLPSFLAGKLIFGILTWEKQS